MTDFDDIKYAQRIINDSSHYSEEDVAYARLIIRAALHHQIQEQIVTELRDQISHR
jgi:hypothetical protein